MRSRWLAILWVFLMIPFAARAVELGEFEDEFGEGKLRPMPERVDVKAVAVEKRAAKGRGLAPLRPVPRGMRPRTAIAQTRHRSLGSPFLEILENRQRKVMLAMGLITPDFRPAKQRARAFEQAVAGLYNHQHRHFVIVVPDPLPKQYRLDEVSHAHEFTHALQDQHFDLAVVRGNIEADAAAAVQGLIEGDAVYSQLVYMMKIGGTRGGFVPDIGRRYGEYFRKSTLNGWKSQPAGERIARADLERMIFPYVYGPQFVGYLVENAPGWRAVRAKALDSVEPAQVKAAWALVDRAYADRPQSTEQILHPEKYLKDRDHPHRIGEPNLAGVLDGWKRLESSEMGEFGLRVWFDEFLPEDAAVRAAAGWDGDRLLVFERAAGAGGDADGPFLVAAVTIWDSDRDAEEFFQSAAVTLTMRTDATPQRLSRDPRLLRWKAPEDPTGARLERWGRLVALVHGADEATAAAVTKRLFEAERRVDYGDRGKPKE